MKTLIFLLILYCAAIVPAFGQKSAKQPKPADQSRGTIFGTVLDETGSPMVDALVSLSPVGSRAYGDFLRETTDRDGRFNFENLKPRQYGISVNYAGYVLPEDSENPPKERKTYQINQEVNLTLKKGGVITGKVFGADGVPIIKIRVRTVKIRDEFGRLVPAQEPTRFSQQNFTDDRGVYRLFGLEAGGYLVFVGGKDNFYDSDLQTEGNSPVYHPSDSVDTAREISVGYGRETNAVDINFRQIQGFVVSGSVSGAKPGGSDNGRVDISLINSANGVDIIQTTVSPRDGKYSFQIEQIPDGEYEIRAFQFDDKGIFSRNPLQKIKIRGADVSGVKINLISLASIKGDVKFEKNPALKQIKECHETDQTAVASMIIKFDSAAKEKSILDPIERSWQNNVAAPDEKGNFTINGLENGKYFLKLKFPDKNLYVKDFYKQISPKEQRNLKSGLSLGAGEISDNVKIILSDGAVQINGKIVVSKENLAENRSGKWIVYLIPADEENKDNVLLYAESVSDSNNKFSFENIRPGNYFLSIENYSIDAGKVKNISVPKFYDHESRTKLYQAAKNKKVEAITLQSCQNSLIEITQADKKIRE